MNNKKTDRQLAFEIQAHEEAKRRLIKSIEKAKSMSYYSSSIPARATLGQYLLPSAEYLVEYYTEQSKGVASYKCSQQVSGEMLRLFEDVSPETIAAILLKCLLDLHGVHHKLTGQKAASRIGYAIEDEARFQFYTTTSPPDVVAAMMRRVSMVGSSPKYRRVSTKLITERMLTETHNYSPEMLFPTWSDRYRNLVGASLLEVGVRCNIVQYKTIQGKKKKQKYVELHPDILFKQHEIFSEVLNTSYMKWCLLDKPIPWLHQDCLSKDNTSGGYHNDWIRNELPLCRGRHYRTEFGELSIDFLNTISQTPWCIDKDILDVSKLLLDKGESIGSFKSLHRDPRLDEGMPERLKELPSDNQEKIEYRTLLKNLHETHQDNVRSSIRTRMSVTEATEFLSHPRFYLSWSNDYRGRCYTHQSWLSPHSTDSEKALIRFADGCRLDKRAEWWAAQAVGSAYLGSRLNLEDRVKWTYDNYGLICKVVEDPYGNIDLWSKAKDKFQFLQLAIEWDKVVINRTEHLWHLPVGADATASGLQLLSSMLRDEKGMKYSNVLPPDDVFSPPEDAYMVVLEVAKRLAKDNPETEHLVEHLCHRGIGKTMMVQVYGAKWGTIKSRIVDVFKDDDVGLFPKVVTHKDCGLIASLVIQASKEVFPYAFKALGWLSKLARIAVKDGQTELCWNTPSSDLIRLREYETDVIDIRTSHMGKIRIPTGRGAPDTKSVISALPPSFIHSYDAALLKVAFVDWKYPLTPIHDQIKTLPIHMDDALDRVRRAFYKVCNGNPLDRLANDLGVTPDVLPRLQQGKGELGKVISSTYLFN